MVCSVKSRMERQGLVRDVASWLGGGRHPGSGSGSESGSDSDPGQVAMAVEAAMSAPSRVPFFSRD